MLIGLNGQAESGKDTTYQRVLAMAVDPSTVHRLGFSDLMKQSISALFKISLQDIEVYKRDPEVVIELKKSGEVLTSLNFREFIQEYGTAAHRGILGNDFWIEKVFPNMEFDHSNGIYMVTDCRFPNELMAIRKLGGFIVRVNGSNVSQDPHPSEQIIDQILIDYELDNSEKLIPSLDGQIKSFFNLMGCSESLN